MLYEFKSPTIEGVHQVSPMIYSFSFYEINGLLRYSIKLFEEISFEESSKEISSEDISFAEIS